MSKESQDQSINPHAKDLLLKNRTRQFSVAELLVGIRQGDRTHLSKAITLIESKKEEDQQIAEALIEQCLSISSKSIRIGITGSPGVGKSTFIDSFGTFLCKNQHQVAVLAIDPSSSVSHGSILGDKTRMERLSVDANAFIRPSAAGDTLGGVARKTRETILLCEAAGFDTIIVETVGVGQSETAVYQLTDLFLLLLQPGAGDELQGIKRGIVEMADILAINKCDGERMTMSKLSKGAYTNALHLFQPKSSAWTPPVLTCSAANNEGIEQVWESIMAYQQKTTENQYFEKKRKSQILYWFEEALRQSLEAYFFDNPIVRKEKSIFEQRIVDNQLSPFKAVDQLMKLIQK